MSALGASTLLLGLAWFAVINVVLSAVSWCLAQGLLVSRYRERGGLILGLRLLPAASATVFVTTMFAPGHWRLEPVGSDESFGVVVYAAAALGFAIVCLSAWRGARLVRAGRVLLRREPPVAGVSLAGIVRTRILVGREVLTRLTPGELDVAIAHERAHRTACDNLKRFAIACAPDLLGASRTARRLEERWHAAAEAAADARAVDGDERRALNLASALVKVAKLDVEKPLWPSSPVWSLLHDPPLLESRIRRLVAGHPPASKPPRITRAVLFAAMGTVAVLLTGVALAGTLHRLTETLVRTLP
jgi:Zn-dependent protease with chaperone function